MTMMIHRLFSCQRLAFAVLCAFSAVNPASAFHLLVPPSSFGRPTVVPTSKNYRQQQQQHQGSFSYQHSSSSTASTIISGASSQQELPATKNDDEIPQINRQYVTSSLFYRVKRGLFIAPTKKFLRVKAMTSTLGMSSGNWTWRGSLFAGLAFSSAFLSLVNVLVPSRPLGLIMGLLCTLMTMVAFVLQKRISEYESMRTMINKLTAEVNSISAANAQLKKDNIKLDENAQQLKRVGSELSIMSEEQDVNIDELVQQIDDYRKIQDRVEADLRNQIKQTIISVVMRSDLDQDYQISPTEIDLLVLRLNSLPSVKLNEKEFRAIMKETNGSIITLLDKHLRDDEVIKKENIFDFGSNLHGDE